MESTTNEVPKLTGGRLCQTTDYKLCVVCQKEAEPLVLHPRLTSYHNLLETVKERASLHDTDCVPMQKRLKDCTAETLQIENAVWHRTCYSRMTNTVQREHARDRQQHSMCTGHTLPGWKVADQEVLMTWITWLAHLHHIPDHQHNLWKRTCVSFARQTITRNSSLTEQGMPDNH